jgi:hypothetical protein
VPESAEELYRRALGAADADGRLSLPPLDEWDTFPFRLGKRSSAASDVQRADCLSDARPIRASMRLRNCS